MFIECCIINAVNHQNYSLFPLRLVRYIPSIIFTLYNSLHFFLHFTSKNITLQTILYSKNSRPVFLMITYFLLIV